MPIKHGPAYRLPCPASGYWVGSTSGKTYCHDCSRPITLRKDGKLRAHKGPVLRRVVFTGRTAADVESLASLFR